MARPFITQWVLEELVHETGARAVVGNRASSRESPGHVGEVNCMTLDMESSLLSNRIMVRFKKKKKKRKEKKKKKRQSKTIDHVYSLPLEFEKQHLVILIVNTS